MGNKCSQNIGQMSLPNGSLRVAPGQSIYTLSHISFCSAIMNLDMFSLYFYECNPSVLLFYTVI